MEIKLKNPRTCCHCRAYRDTGCGLGYLTKNVPSDQGKWWIHIDSWNDVNVTLVPAEPCPKPKNIAEFVNVYTQVDLDRHLRPNADDIMMTKEESHIYYINLNSNKP